MPKGWFITIEGGEGTGKSTQLELLRRHLEDRGHDVVVSREPGGTTLAEAIRSLLLDPRHEPDGLVEIFLLEAARHDHVERIVRPAVERGAVVLCDRYVDSSVVYQGMVRGVGVEEVSSLNRLATGGLEPDLTLVFDMEPDSAVDRARDRNSAASNRESRFDDEPGSFHRRVQDGFRKLAAMAPDRVRVVDASGDSQVVFHRVLEALPEELQ